MDKQLAEYIIQRIEAIDNKVDELLKFKYQIIGGSVLLSLFVTAAFQIVMLITKGA